MCLTTATQLVRLPWHGLNLTVYDNQSWLGDTRLTDMPIEESMELLQLQGARRYLEWGSGGSTVLALARGKQFAN